MKNPFDLKLVSLSLSIALLLLTAVSSQDNAEKGTAKTGQTGQWNHLVARYVIGSGGVITASNAKQWHWATAGQTIIDGAHNQKYFLMSGFWHLPAFGPSDVGEIDKDNVPGFFDIQQNYPNPFNPQTAIQYDLPCQCLVTIEIFNVMG